MNHKRLTDGERSLDCILHAIRSALKDKFTCKLKNINVLLWNKIFRKDLLREHKIEYPKKYEQDDIIFVYKYLANSKTYYGIEKCLYNYVVGNPNSIMGKVFTNKNI